MNFKKFISGVSAFAIAASAFAAMTVTASADAVTTTKYGQIIGIDFGSTDSANPFANTVDLSSATIDGYTYASGDGDFTGGLAAAANITDGTTTTGKNKKVTPAANMLALKNAEGSVNIPSGLQVNTSKDKVNITFKMAFGSIGKKFAGFYINDSSSTLASLYYDAYNGSFNSNTFEFSKTELASTTDNAGDMTKAVTFDITIDYAAKQMIASTTNSNGTTTHDPIDLPDGAGAVAEFKVKSNNSDSTRWSFVDDIAITNIEGESVSLYDYTVNYTLNNVTVDSDTGSKIDGASVAARTGYFDYTDANEVTTRYYIADGATTSFTIDAEGTNVFEVPVRVANTYTASAVSSTGVAFKDATSVTEGDTFSYAYPKYITDSSSKVIASLNDTSTYGKNETPSGDDLTKTYTVDYSAYNGTAYFYEAESNTNSTARFESYNMSSGAGVRGLQSGSGGRQVSITVPESGIYDIEMGGNTHAAGAKDLYISLNTIDEEDRIGTLSVNYFGYGQYVDTVATGVVLTAGDKLYVKGQDGSAGCDYVLLTKTGDLAEVSEVTSAGTFDEFEDAIVKAFTFTVTPNAQTVTAITVTDTDNETKTQTKDGLSLTGSGAITFGILATATDAANLPNGFTATITVE